MKKLLCLILVLLMAVLVLAACTPNKPSDSTPDTESGVIDSNTASDTENDTSLPSDTATDNDNIIDTGSDNLDSDIPNNPDDSDTDVDDSDSDTINNGSNDDYLYTDFTADEKSTYNEYVGFVIPFLPADDYYIEKYDEDGYRGVYYSALCESKGAFNSYLALFSIYEYDGTDTDEYGDIWYLYSKDDVYIDICYYEYDGAYYVDVDAYSESSGGNGGNGGDGGDGGNDGNNEHLYYDFTDEEKDTYSEYVGFVIPFLPTDDYYIEEYDEDGYRGVYYSALCDNATAFNWYLAMFAFYGSDGTEVDEYGDTWYLYSKDDVYIDVCYYEYDGAYYVDVDAYSESSGGNGESGGNGGNGGVSDESVITNAGAGLPADKGSGIYDVNFKDADKVKDVTDQGYYLDGCPTVGSPGVLVIPVEFSDRTASSLGYSIENIKHAFEKNGKTDYYSVYDYYYVSSLGQLSLDITVVDSWFKPSMPSTYYANRTMNYEGDNVLIGDQMVMDEALAYLAKIMDLSEFDSDSNGTIDSVVLISTLEIDPDSDFYWAYRYWNIYTDSDEYYYEYDGVSANDYLWAPYAFMHENPVTEDYTDTDIMNTYTFIHEFGHVLGIDDYYDTAYVDSPLGGYDIMDSMTGDHNPYTKFNLGWITSSRLVVTDTSVTLTLEAFSESGDTIILANNYDPSLGVYQEYYILAYYTNDGLNTGMGGYFNESGIVVYHVNASLFYEEYDGEIYYDVYNNNTDISDIYGTKNNLIELIENGTEYIFAVGDSMISVTDDLGNILGYTFTVDALSDTEATITVSAK